MLFQQFDIGFFLIWMLIATIILTLILYLAVRLIVSKIKANEHKFTIILLALIIVLLLYFIRPAVALVLQIIGDGLAGIRNVFDNKGHNYLINLVPIIGFLIIMVLTKTFLKITWDKSTWIALLTLFVLYIFYSLVPELFTFIQIG